MRSLFFKKKYLEFILEGKKPLEGRVGYNNIRNLKIGDLILLNGRFRAQIIDIRRYPTFKDAINEKNYKLLIPDASSIDETIKMYEKIFPLEKQIELGIYILELRYPI